MLIFRHSLSSLWSISVALLLVTVALTGCGGPSVEITGGVFGVAHVSPNHGAIEVGLDTAIEIGFSNAVDQSTLSGVRLLREVGNETITVENDAQIIDGATGLILIPVDFLEASTRYRVLVPAEVASSDGVPLGAVLRSEFQTAAAQ